MLSRLDNKTNYVVLVSSSLWDLSSGCNNQLGVTTQYQEQYLQGILELYAAIYKLLPKAPICWRTSPTTSVQHDAVTTQKGAGRTRANQETLNVLLRETVSENNLGTVLDWWAQSKDIPRNHTHAKWCATGWLALPKGISLAIFQHVLNAVFDREPTLLS